MEGQLRRVRLRLATVVVIIFVFVSSGAFGLEDMVGWSGPGIALLLLLVLPVVWALPMGLVCAELGSAIPEEGGYYVWVKRALGEYWGFQCGWWSWLTTFVDSALYIALVTDYLQSWLDLDPTVAWLMGVAVIAVLAYLNIRGLNVIAVSSIVMVVIILTPFVVLTILGFANWHGVPWQPFAYPDQSVLTSIGYALAVGMWMYSGYDSMSVLAGEVEEPRRVIPRGLMIAMPLIVISYFVPTLAALGGVGRWDEWTTEGGISFVEIAEQLGGTALGVAMLVAAVVSNLALYQEYLAQGSRPAYAMAADHLLPRVLTRTHHKYGTPWVSDRGARGDQRGTGALRVRDADRDRRLPHDVLLHPDLRRGGGAARTRAGDGAALPGVGEHRGAGGDLRAGGGDRGHRAVHQRDGLAHRRAGRRAHRADRLPHLQAAVPTQAGPAGGGRRSYSPALNSIGLFSQESVEKRQSALGGSRTSSPSPWCIAPSTLAGASSP